MDFYSKKFQQRCMLMFSMLLMGVMINFAINSYGTQQRTSNREEMTRQHQRLENKLDTVNRKLDLLLKADNK